MDEEKVYLDEAGLTRVLGKMVRTPVQIPTITTTEFSFDGASHTPTFQNLDTTKVSVSQESASYTQTGTYPITLSLKDSRTTVWSDGTDADKIVYFKILKADNIDFTLGQNSISGTYYTTQTVDVEYSGDKGIVRALSNDENVVNAEIVGSKIVVTMIGSGTTTITVTDNGDSNYNYTTKSISVNITSNAVSNVSWSNGSDTQIAMAIKQADAGIIDLYEDLGWRVGDERSITIDEIQSTGSFDGVTWNVGEAQQQQNATLVLLDRGANQTFTLTKNVKNKDGSDRAKPSFVYGFKQCLSTAGYMNSSNTSSGGWPSCARRAWCNGGLRQALPEWLREVSKQCSVRTSTKFATSEGYAWPVVSYDYFALLAAKEFIEGCSFESLDERNQLSQFEYYKTASNRTKNTSWWTRSVSDYSTFIYSSNGGSLSRTQPNTNQGILPFGFI